MEMQLGMLHASPPPYHLDASTCLEFSRLQFECFGNWGFRSQDVWRHGWSGEEMGGGEGGLGEAWEGVAGAYLAPVSGGRKFGPFIWWASSKTHRGQTDATEAYLTPS